MQSCVFSYGGTVDYIDVDEEGWFYIGMETAENQKIETYDDIIGKEFVFFGDPATGSMGNESLYSVKVSGIVDVGGANFIRRSPYAILHSVAWRETFWSTLKDKVRYMTQVPAVDHDLARTCADLTMEMIDEYVEIYPEARDRNLISVGVEGITGLVDPTLPNYYNFWAGHKAYVFLGAVSGAFFRHLFRAVVLAPDDFHACRAAHQDRHSPFFGCGREGRCKNRAAVCLHPIGFYVFAVACLYACGLLRVPLSRVLYSDVGRFRIFLHGVDGAHFGGAFVRRAAAVLHRAAQKIFEKVYRR